MHPSSALVSCLTAIVAVQFFGYAGMSLVLLGLLTVARPVRSGWWVLLRRMRWLLLSIWVILAYGTPGEALFDLAWMPTHEGANEATLHMVRLMLILGCLAWLFSRLDHRGLLIALVSLLQPLSRCGLATDRLVVRLSLVIENLQLGLPKGAWRGILLHHADKAEGPASLQVTVPSWQSRDYLYCVGTLLVSLFAISLG